MPTRNVDLPEDLDRFLETAVSSGRFADASEAVREGLRLLKVREKEDRDKLEALRAAAKIGFDELDRGEYVTLNSEEEIENYLIEIHNEVVAKRAKERPVIKSRRKTA